MFHLQKRANDVAFQCDAFIHQNKPAEVLMCDFLRPVLRKHGVRYVDARQLKAMS